MSAAGLVIILGSSPIITDEERSARLFVPVGICGDIPPPVPVLHNGSAVVEVGCCSGEQVRADRGMKAIRADVARSQPLLCSVACRPPISIEAVSYRRLSILPAEDIDDLRKSTLLLLMPAALFRPA